MQTMNINGKEYKIIGEIESKLLSRIVPLVDIKLMTDEEERQLSRQNAVDNYRRKFGREPESVDAACKWQRKWIDEMIREGQQ